MPKILVFHKQSSMVFFHASSLRSHWQREAPRIQFNTKQRREREKNEMKESVRFITHNKIVWLYNSAKDEHAFEIHGLRRLYSSLNLMPTPYNWSEVVLGKKGSRNRLQKENHCTTHSNPLKYMIRIVTSLTSANWSKGKKNKVQPG